MVGLVKMATPSNHDHDAPSRSSSASLSSPPHTSPEPGSPSAQFATESPHSITVNPIGFDFNPNATGKATATKAAAQPPRERKKPGESHLQSHFILSSLALPCLLYLESLTQEDMFRMFLLLKLNDRSQTQNPCY